MDHASSLLPIDIGRLIIEALAEELILSDRKECLKLVVVSRLFKDWIEPILYRSLVFDSKRAIDALTWTLSHSTTKPSDFFARHVKFVVMTFSSGIDADSISLVLRRCSGVTSLATWVPDYEFRYPPGFTLPLTNLRRLSIHVCSPLCPASVAALASLTHLKLYFANARAVLDWAHWKALSQLNTSLKYLSISTLGSCLPGKQTSLADVVRTCQQNIPSSCQGLIIQPCDEYTDHDDELLALLNGEERRVVVMLSGVIDLDTPKPRTVEYPMDKSRRIVLFYQTYADCVSEWDGSRAFKDEKDIWAVGLDVIEKAGKKSDEQSWEV